MYFIYNRWQASIIGQFWKCLRSLRSMQPQGRFLLESARENLSHASPLASGGLQVVIRFPGGSDGKESAHNAGDLGSIPGSGRSPGEGNDYPLQSSCLENPMDRGTWQAAVYGVAKSQTNSFTN